MASTLKTASAFLALAASQAANAQTIYYDCDTPAGNYSEIRFNQNQPSYRVRGTITPMELRAGGNWRPTATVYVQSQDKKYAAAIQLLNNGGKALDVTVNIVDNAQPKKADAGFIKNNESVQFDLYLPSSGPAFAVVHGTRVPLGISVGPNAKVSITCSSGHFRFDPLDWNWQPIP